MAKSKKRMRLWVLPTNDLESLEISRLLNESHEDFVVTGQRWGASWASLEADVLDRIQRFHPDCPSCSVYGVELRGPGPTFAVNIDHHLYSEDRRLGFAAEDRRHKLTSIEQVASIIGLELDRFRQLVARNDAGYIPAMRAFGATEEEIQAIRKADRQAQGLTLTDELNAEADVGAAEKRGDRARVRCTDRPTSAHVDRLFGSASEILLTSQWQWEYYGQRYHQFFSAMDGETAWEGGTAPNGFAGVQKPTKHSQARILAEFWG